jgi:hypothetical protein
MTGAQQQLSQQASQSQASQAYQQAMQRLAGIEEQQRLYAQSARQQGLESGMDQSWKNLDQYRTNTGAAQTAENANYGAMLQGDQLLGQLTQMDAGTQFAGAGGLANARSQLSGDIRAGIGGAFDAASAGNTGIVNMAGQITNLAGTQYGLNSAFQDDLLNKTMAVPTFNYQTQSGFNQGDYGVGTSALQQAASNATNNAIIRQAGDYEALMMGRGDRQRAEDIAMQKEAIDKQIAAVQAQQEADNNAGMWGTIGSLLGTAGGGVAGFLAGGGNPLTAMMGASMGGSLLGNTASGLAGGGTRNAVQQPNYMQYAPLLSQMNNKAPTNNMVGIAPTMNGQYGLGIDPSLYNAPFSRYTGYPAYGV